MTYYRWRKEYGDLKLDHFDRRLRPALVDIHDDIDVGLHMSADISDLSDSVDRLHGVGVGCVEGNCANDWEPPLPTEIAAIKGSTPPSEAKVRSSNHARRRFLQQNLPQAEVRRLVPRRSDKGQKPKPDAGIRQVGLVFYSISWDCGALARH